MTTFLRAIILGFGIAFTSTYAQTSEQTFFKKYAPYLQDQTAAFDQFAKLLKSLPRGEREAASRRFGAFALRNPSDRQHCTSPYDLAGVEVIENRQDAVLFICRRNMMLAAESVATVLLIFATDASLAEKERALDSWGNNTGKLAAMDFQRSRRGESYSRCVPAYLAYAYLRGVSLQDCLKLNPAEVRDYMWQRLRPIVQQMGITSLDLADSKTYWTLQDTVIENTMEIIFNLSTFHEIGHLVKSDPWIKRSSEEAELDADSFSFASTGKAGIDNEALLPLVSIFIVSHVGATADEWGKIEPSSLVGRLRAHGAGLMCGVRELLAAKPALRALGDSGIATAVAAYERQYGKVNCTVHAQRK